MYWALLTNLYEFFFKMKSAEFVLVFKTMDALQLIYFKSDKCKPFCTKKQMHIIFRGKSSFV